MTTRKSGLPRAEGERGSVLVLVAASLLVFLLGAAFVVDIGNARQIARNYQNAADGAALAGSQELKIGQAQPQRAVDFAADYAFQTLLSLSRPAETPCSDPQFAGEVPSGGGGSGSPHCYALGGVRVYVTTPWNDPVASGTMLPGGNESSQIHVKICGQVITGFSRVVGINLIRPCRLSTAIAYGPNPCAVCVLTGSFVKSGNGTATVTGSAAWINSNATNSGPQTSFSAPDGFYVGGSASGFAPPPDTGVPPVNDPLEWLPAAMQRQPNWAPPYLPDRLSFTFDPTGGLNQWIDPGVWNNIRVNAGTSNHTLTLNPGFYVVRGKFEILGDVNVVGNNVTIYFACDFYWQNPCAGDPGPAAYFDHRGAGNVTLSATSAPGDPYQNLLFFFDRDANHTELNRFSGGSANITGTIYAPGAQFEVGSGAFDSLFVVGSLQLPGNGPLNITYDPSEQVPTYLPSLIR